MPKVTSAVNEDGSTDVIATDQPSNFEFEHAVVQGDLPDVPTTESLSKLFIRRNVLNVKAPDGTVIPFIYKKGDPMSALIALGSPLAVDTNVKAKLNTLIVDTDALAAEVRKAKTDDDLDDETKSKVRDLINNDDAQFMMEQFQNVRRIMLKSNVISPTITDEIYDNLDEEVITALYDAITGGVTSDNELVNTFPEDAEDGSK